MTAPELRSFVRTVFDGLDDDQRTTITDLLVTRATKGYVGWKPSRPSTRVVDEARAFADAARRVAYADPDEVSDYLRHGTRAFLAGDHASARAVFEALLLPVAQGDITLGQHEMVEEVLNVDLHVTIAQFVTSVYTTTPLDGRANAVYSAITHVEAVATLASPIGDMESVSAGALPDLGPFLPRWMKRLERVRPAEDDWDSPPERWLREAVFRKEGVDGLERLARKTKRPQACLAWCEALAARGDWPTALCAYDDAAKLVGKSPWRGELLDGAAQAAQQLGQSDLVTRLEAAWVGAPSLVRLLRWLVAPGPPSLTLVTKARRALKPCPKTDGRQLGLLRIVTGDLGGAAMRVAAEKRIEGILGQSRRRHYGHAATLVASCLAVAPRHRQKAASDWIAQLLVAHSRRHAFKEERQATLKSVGLTVPLRPA